MASTVNGRNSPHISIPSRTQRFCKRKPPRPKSWALRPRLRTGSAAFLLPRSKAARGLKTGQFHPLKFAAALLKDLTVYEQTRVTELKDQEAVTDRGRVFAKDIVFATHYPFVNVPGFYFARLHQERSYVLALRDAPKVEGMALGIDSPSYSFRNSGDYLLLGGAGHRTGENQAGGRYEDLRRQAKAWYPDAKEAYYWSAQDGITPDAVPYIGRYSSSRPHWYVAAGFQKWGMTSSMVAARTLAEMITGKANDGAGVFSPSGCTWPHRPRFWPKTREKRYPTWPKKSSKPRPRLFWMFCREKAALWTMKGKKLASTAMKRGTAFTSPPAAPIWAASLRLTRTNAPGNAPATVPGSTTGESCWTAPPRRTSLWFLQRKRRKSAFLIKNNLIAG